MSPQNFTERTRFCVRGEAAIAFSHLAVKRAAGYDLNWGNPRYSTRAAGATYVYDSADRAMRHQYDWRNWLMPVNSAPNSEGATHAWTRTRRYDCVVHLVAWMPSGMATTTGKFGMFSPDGNAGPARADRRYYASTYGRFNTVDSGAVKLSDPVSWNRYSYTGGDPVNRNDRRGLCWVDGNTGDEIEDEDWNWEVYEGIYQSNYSQYAGGCRFGVSFPGGDDGATGGVADQPGGGRTGGIPGPAISSASQAKDALLRALDYWKNCDKVLGSNALAYANNTIKFVDSGLQTQAFAQADVRQIGTTRLGSAVVQTTGTIELFANFYGGEVQQPFSTQAEVLVHELIHAAFNLTKWDHSDVIAKFNISTAGYSSIDDAINNWIGRDCQ